MDIIKFKLRDMYEVLDENEDFFEEHRDQTETEPQDGNCFVVDNYRIVIPELHVSFREANWFALDPDSDPDDPEAWEIQDSVYLMYEENEKDINKWLSSCTKSIDYSLYGPCADAGYPMEKRDELDCYIEFDE